MDFHHLYINIFYVIFIPFFSLCTCGKFSEKKVLDPIKMFNKIRKYSLKNMRLKSEKVA